MAREALSVKEKALIQIRIEEGKRLHEIASELGSSVICVRKHWRRIRNKEKDALSAPQWGTKRRAVLCSVDKEIVDEIKRLKQEHSAWGVDRMLAELKRLQAEEHAADPEWVTLRFPGRTQLSLYFKKHYKVLEPSNAKRKVVKEPPKVAEASHENWQLDMQEDLLLGDNSCATTCTIRDEYSGAIIASDVFLTIEPSAAPPAATTRGRKLAPAEQWSVIEQGMKRFGILPAVLQTDNEAQMAGSSASDFPTLFTLRLAGCGIVHRCTRPHHPTDNAEVERTHLTLDGFVQSSPDLANLASLRAALQREIDCHNRFLLSRSRNCITAQGAGRAPLEAHPELIQPERFAEARRYPQAEDASPFLYERVLPQLAALRFERSTTSKGQLTFGGFRYTIGTRFAKRRVAIHFDLHTNEWVFSSLEAAVSGTELARRPNTSHTADTILALIQPRSVHKRR